MDFEISPEQQELIDSVRSMLARECPSALVRDVVENGSAPEQPWKSARELGFTSLGLVIEQHGYCVAPGPFLAEALPAELRRHDLGRRVRDPAQHHRAAVLGLSRS